MKTQPQPTLYQVPVAVCRPHEANRLIRDEDVAELADSIRAVGLLNPIHVRKTGDGFQIIAGERRWRAHRLIEAELIPAFVYEHCDDVTADTLRLVENDQRREPTALDTARELRRIKNVHGLTHEGVAEQTGIAVDRVKRYLSLFQASDDLLAAFEKHRLPVKVALALTRYEKECGEADARTVIRRLVSGEITSRDVETLRKRKANPATTKAKTEMTPWDRAETRIQQLIRKDPAGARMPMARLTKLLQQSLKEQKEDAAA